MNPENSTYGIKKISNLSYSDTVLKITETLKDQGFGILTEIDVKETLKKKIDKDFTPYIILGACNPILAYEALTNEIDVGLLLPCNIVVYENPKDQKIVVAAIDPTTMVQITDRSDLNEFAQAVKEKLTQAISKV
ncbi:MAG: hypothetical protein ACI86H_000320 [bacterium]|jgi:uncharacterized protein (DUF302 family)